MAPRWRWQGIFLWIWLVWALFALAQEKPPHQDAPAPQPTAEMKALLDEAKTHLDAKRTEDALKSLDRALELAKQKGDWIGQARVYRAQALIWEQEKPSEALEAWRRAYEAFGQAGDRVGQGESMLGQAVLVYREEKERAEQLVAQALEWADKERERPLAMAGVLNRRGVDFLHKGVLGLAGQLFEGALRLCERVVPDSLEVAESLNNLGAVAYARGDLAVAEEYFKRALAIQQRLAPNSLEMARSLNNLGTVARERGELARAEDYYKQALEIYERLAPNSLEMATILNNLGTVARARGELARAEEYYKQALEIYKRLAPNSLKMAAILNNLGTVARARGELAQAEKYFEQALAIYERLAPNSLEVATSLNNLGNVAAAQGDLARAEDYYKQALAIQERLAPNSLDVAMSLGNLGLVAHDRGDLASAEDYYKRALEIFERLAPNSLEVAKSLGNLGNVAHDRGDLASAEDYHKRALEIFERLAPGSLDVATSLNNLGTVAYDRGDLARAEDYYKQALAIRERLAPNSLKMATILNNLGTMASDRGELALAEDYYKRALAIRERLAPDSLNIAMSLTSLSLVAIQRKDWQTAQEHLQRATQIIEIQRQHIPDPESRMLFLEQYSSPHTLLVMTLLATQKPARAIETLERARARTLVELITEQEWRLNPDVPDELRKRQRELDARRLRAYRELAKANANTPPQEVKRWQEELKKVSAEQRILNAELRRASPRYAQLHFPPPLTLKHIQQSLDEGTLLISYVLTDYGSWLVTVTRERVHSYPLVAPPKEVQKQVLSYRNLLIKPDTDRAVLARQGKALYDLLLKPAEAELKQAKRLLVMPDGILHRLPFGTLVVETQPDGRPTYLIERLPVHITPSIGTYRLVRSYPRDRQLEYALLAVGDPAYPKPSQEVAMGAPVSPELSKEVAMGDPAYPELSKEVAMRMKRLRERGLRLEPLPHTRKEVEALAKLYGTGVQVLLDKQATVSAVLAQAPRARVLHLACHGLLDNIDPLGSALAFTPSGEADDGLLRAYQVLGEVKLQAELVVLSACETGRGTEWKHEGVVGLSWSFLGAGARSVVVSLWSVSDESTARLMEGFYRQWRAGGFKDEALRRAQLALIRSGQYGHPYYWGAFVLVGDYR